MARIICLLAAAAAVTSRCVDSLLPITASGTNFDLSSGVRPVNATVPVSGTFRIQLRFCEPAIPIAIRSSTLQVLVHGLSYNTNYWDPKSPEVDNYVQFASRQGFATLNMARLGA